MTSAASFASDVQLPALVRALVGAPYPAKAWVAQRPNAWRWYVSACRRLGWSSSCLGWHCATNGPFAGIRIEALHANHLWAAAGLYEPAVAACVLRLLADRRVAAGEMWDIGANRGLMSLLGARHGAARVLAVELSPGNIALLERQLAANPHLADRIEMMNVAASDRDGDIDVVVNGHDGAICQIIAAGVAAYARTPATSVVRGASRSLDSLAAERRVRVGLLKIDVEGAEALVLRGAQRLLRDAAPAVVLEIHNDEAGRDSIDLLTAAGYRCERVGVDGSLTPTGDNVGYGHIVARVAR